MAEHHVVRHDLDAAKARLVGSAKHWRRHGRPVDLEQLREDVDEVLRLEERYEEVRPTVHRVQL